MKIYLTLYAFFVWNICFPCHSIIYIPVPFWCVCVTVTLVHYQNARWIEGSPDLQRFSQHLEVPCHESMSFREVLPIASVTVVCIFTFCLPLGWRGSSRGIYFMSLSLALQYNVIDFSLFFSLPSNSLMLGFVSVFFSRINLRMKFYWLAWQVLMYLHFQFFLVFSDSVAGIVVIEGRRCSDSKCQQEFISRTHDSYISMVFKGTEQ
jgi:hypothetical protein